MTHADLFSGIGGFSLSARLKALGNALCPQQVYPILLAVRERIG